MTLEDQRSLEREAQRLCRAGLGPYVVAIFEGGGMIVERKTWDKFYEQNPMYIFVKEVS